MEPSIWNLILFARSHAVKTHGTPGIARCPDLADKTVMEKKPMPMDEDAWRKSLTPEQYRVLREKGTEAPFTGEYVHADVDGTFACVACGNALFSSDAKFDSGTGWPSFDQALPGAVVYSEDTSHGRNRTEITCANCGSHLGHVFDDGPTESGKRYCINSVCLNLDKKD